MICPYCHTPDRVKQIGTRNRDGKPIYYCDCRKDNKSFFENTIIEGKNDNRREIKPRRGKKEQALH